jgi:competence protein ComEA
MKFIRVVAVLLLMMVGSYAQTPAPKTGAAQKSAPAGAQTAGLIDINRASAAELKTIPGIGDAYSAAIVKRRPYKNKTQLRSMGVIPPAVYEKIKDKIVAKQ